MSKKSFELKAVIDTHKDTNKKPAKVLSAQVDARKWCGNCRKKRQFRLNGAGMWICKCCGCYRSK